MSPHQVELALKKQRLQFRSAALRDELAAHARVFEPIFAAGDKVSTGVHWLLRHREVTIAAAVALLVARPRALFRWGRRGVVAWQAWRRISGWLAVGRTV